MLLSYINIMLKVYTFLLIIFLIILFKDIFIKILIKILQDE